MAWLDTATAIEVLYLFATLLPVPTVPRPHRQ